MTDITAPFDIAMPEAAAGLRREAAEMARFPEMVNGLLRQMLDEDDDVRLDAAQMLVLLPETTPGYGAVRDAIVAAFSREEDSRIRLMLAERVDAYAAEGDNHAFLALQGGARSDASVAVRRWCLSGLSSVHPGFIAEAERLLQSLRDVEPDFREDIEESLSTLTHRRRAEKLKRGATALRELVGRATASVRFKSTAVAHPREVMHGSQGSLRWFLYEDGRFDLTSEEMFDVAARVKLLREIEGETEELFVYLVLRDDYGHGYATLRFQSTERVTVDGVEWIRPESADLDADVLLANVRISYDSAIRSDAEAHTAWRRWIDTLPKALRIDVLTVVPELDTPE